MNIQKKQYLHKPKKITAVKGMNDILPPASAAWDWLEEKIRSLMNIYAYRNIRTPIVESTALFVRGLGEITDIVEKEMYSFEDRLNGENLTLRPECTAGVVRAVVEHSMLYDGGKRLYYMGPMFRHERPQRGRYRQFHQIGAEAIGFPGPELDAELILLADSLWKILGLDGIRLEINSLGQPNDRKAHRNALISYFEKNIDFLDEDARRRLYSNPLRILDTKNPAMQSLVNAAPRLLDFLSDESIKHFDAVKSILNAAGVVWKLNPRLVRGMDYYNLTVFEFITDRLGSQGTICGGGRYDYLVEQVGGKPAPAVGWAIGVERVLELLKEQGAAIPKNIPNVYVVVPSINTLSVAIQVIQKLRFLGVSVQMHSSIQSGGVIDNMKSQLKKADSSGATYALIFGEEEFSRNCLTVKMLRDSNGCQSEYLLTAINDLAEVLKNS